MEQHRLKAYLRLIQKLLSCPNGEEWIVLRQHEELVDSGLIKTMEHVATTLAQEGKQQEAVFLHNWAGQLHHIISQPDRVTPTEDSSKAYLDFIQALLTSTPEEQQELIATHQHLVTPGLVHMMRQISAQLTARGDIKTATYLNRLAEGLGKLWLQQHQFERAPQPQVAETVEESPRPEPEKGASAPQTSNPVDSQEPPQTVLSVNPTELPDPWLTPAPTSPDFAKTDSPKPSQPPASIPVEKTGRDDLLASTLQGIESQLAAITEAITRLNEHLAHPATPTNPIGHLEALEKAYHSGWILTTDEVEALLQVHPSYSGEETAFERGCWRLVKAGKIGHQMGWRVEKTKDSPP